MDIRWNRLLLLLWAGLLFYSLLFAPGSPDDTLQLIKDIMLDPGSVNPIVIAIFNLMGVLPLAYSAVLLFEGRKTGLRSWPFVLGSFFAGAFSLLLYMGFRSPQTAFRGTKGTLLKIMDSRVYGIVLKLVAISLVAYALGAGDWKEYSELFWNNTLVHVMTLDFLVLSAVFPYAMWDDMKRRDWFEFRRFLSFALVPLMGPLTYLWFRPKQHEKVQEKVDQQ
ncbi:MAG: DUF2834 domain-containing protein [Thermoplasmatota archaeon]